MKRNRINNPRTRSKSPYFTKGKKPKKYPFPTGLAYAKAREMGDIKDPTLRPRANERRLPHSPE